VAETAYCASCGGALATDNRTRWCSPCGHHRRETPQVAPADLWTSEEVARATAGRDFGELLRAYRRAFSPAVTQAALGEWLDLSQGQVSRIESGRTVINDLVRLTRWASSLGVPHELLWFRMPSAEAGSEAEDPTSGSTPAEASSVHVPRRPEAPIKPHLLEQPTSTNDVEIIRETTRAFRQIDNRFGASRIRSAVLAYLASEIGPALATDRFSRGARRDFQLAAAELHQLAGWMAYDVGDGKSGKHHLRQALTIASTAGDDALTAEMLAAMSHQAAFSRRAEEAIDLALAARRTAIRSGSPALRAESYALEAQGFAIKGDARPCLDALRRAEREFSTATVENTPTWLAYFDRAYLSAKFAQALRDLGRPTDAERFARDSLQMSEGYERGRLFNTALLSSILVDRGELDEAAAAAQAAIRMAGNVRSVRAQGYLRDVAVRFLPHTAMSGVRALQAQMAALGVDATGRG
jgi:transcriptional regulator with XRE-family HTH domain